MSFILDALKKSEAERQRQAGPALLEMRIVRPARRLPPWAIIVGTLLVGCVLALAWVALRRGGASGAAAPATATAVNPATAAVAPVSAVGTPAGASAGLAPGPPAGTNAPAAGPPVASAPAAPATTSTTAPQPAAAIGEDNPADVEPAEAPSSSAARERAETRALRSYSELGGTMPELRLDLHVYAAKPAERYALINMHKVREGDITPEGVQVKEITPDGVVLEYHGTEFLLGR